MLDNSLISTHNGIILEGMRLRTVVVVENQFLLQKSNIHQRWFFHNWILKFLKI